MLKGMGDIEAAAYTVLVSRRERKITQVFSGTSTEGERAASVTWPLDLAIPMMSEMIEQMLKIDPDGTLTMLRAFVDQEEMKIA